MNLSPQPSSLKGRGGYCDGSGVYAKGIDQTPDRVTNLYKE